MGLLNDSALKTYFDGKALNFSQITVFVFAINPVFFFFINTRKCSTHTKTSLFSYCTQSKFNINRYDSECVCLTYYYFI